MIDCFLNQNKKYRHSSDLILKSFLFERKVSYKEHESFDAYFLLKFFLLSLMIMIDSYVDSL